MRDMWEGCLCRDLNGIETCESPCDCGCHATHKRQGTAGDVLQLRKEVDCLKGLLFGKLAALIHEFVEQGSPGAMALEGELCDLQSKMDAKDNPE